MTRKVLIRIVIALAALFLIAYFASPLLTVRTVIEAGRAGDGPTLERNVDFPAFRDSLKTELRGELMRQMRTEIKGKDETLTALGMMFAPSLVDSAVDAVVTPRTIVAMVRTARAPETRSMFERRSDTPPEPTTKGGNDIRQTYGYRGLNIFAVTLTDPDQPDRHLALLLKRQGLFGWKLAGVDLNPPAV